MRKGSGWLFSASYGAGDGARGEASRGPRVRVGAGDGDQIRQGRVRAGGSLAAATERVKVTTGVVNVFTRSPVLLATSYATLDEPSGGRAVFGIGPGYPLVLGPQGTTSRSRSRACASTSRSCGG